MNKKPISIEARPGNRLIPEWARLERNLIDMMNSSVDIVLKHYLTPDVNLLWPESVKGFTGFSDGNVDNFFEGFMGWPLFYMIGGEDRFLELGDKINDNLIRLLSGIRKKKPGSDRKILEEGGRDALIVNEWFPDQDWMHQGEGAMLFYYLNLADPTNKKNRERARKYGNMLTGNDPDLPEQNFDPEYNVFKTSFFGSNGPAFETYSGPQEYATWMDGYGLAFLDVPGVVTLLDLKDPEKAKRYGEVFNRRLRNADTPMNMLSTTMAVHAYMSTGDTSYLDWAKRYLEAWQKRFYDNENNLPDNVGPHGIVGETMEGKWYGGHYGWTFPHGFGIMGDAMVVGGQNLRLISGKKGCLEWIPKQMQVMLDHAVVDENGNLIPPAKYVDDDSIIEYRKSRNEIMTRPDRVTTEPNFTRKQQKDGWFSFAPQNLDPVARSWYDGFSEEAADVVEKMHRPDTRKVTRYSYTTKDKAGQSGPYMRYLQGVYPEFPIDMLKLSIELVADQERELYDELDGAEAGMGYRPGSDEEWQEVHDATKDLNERYGKHFSETAVHSYLQTCMIYRTTMVNEALVQLTMGGMMPVYNGGMLICAVRWFDADRKRPGMPEDVAVLIDKIGEDSIHVRLCNLNTTKSRRIIAQAGAYGEHEFTAVTVGSEAVDVNDKWLEIVLPPVSETEAVFGMKRYVNLPSLDEPFERE